MSKRIISCLLCVILLISAFPVSAQAEEITYYQILIDAGDGIQTEKAIVEGDEIYVAATCFSKYTRFEFDGVTQTFLVKGQEADKAFKKVTVNVETKKAAVGAKLIELENCFVVDGIVYLPFCQMLPILNADIIDVDSGVIHVVNNELSLAELLYDFDIKDYWFNISEEFFNNERLLFSYVFISYLFDSVVNFRFDRLDIVLESGACEDYKAILTDYLKDDKLFQKAMSDNNFAGDLLASITGLTGITGKLDDVYDWFEKIEKIDYDPLLSDKVVKFIQKANNSDVFDDQLHTWIEVVHGDVVEVGGKTLSVADILKDIDFVYTYLNQVEDHQKMLDAVYCIVEQQNKPDPISGTSSSFIAVDPEYLAAKQIYELYTGNIMPAVTRKAVETTAEKLFEDLAAAKAQGIYSLTASLAGEILELYIPGDSGDRALLLQHSNIANSAMRKAAIPTLDSEKSTDKYRLSLLLTLIASRACYDIMAETASGYGQYDEYYQLKIDKIENMIMGLYLVADNVAFDTYENYETFMVQNRDTITQSGLLDNLAEYKSNTEVFINEVLSEYGRASYTEFVSCIGTWFQEYPASIDGFITAVSVDLNADGKDEQLALISENQSISLQVHSANNGKYVLSCESNITSLDYCSQQNISLFYNNESERYLLFVDGISTGAYTGNNTKYATIYEVDCTQINLVCQASADSFGIATDDLDAQLTAFDVPYAQNCAEISNITSHSQHIELLEIRHKYFNADPMGGWAGREHHLQLLTPETHSKLLESPQIWTITKTNSGIFSPYQEVTYSVELEAGQVFTIYPEWLDGTKSGGIISYEVDTQNRTIMIMMDSPEGCDHWESLVIDLIYNTYYAQGYSGI